MDRSEVNMEELSPPDPRNTSRDNSAEEETPFFQAGTPPPRWSSSTPLYGEDFVLTRRSSREEDFMLSPTVAMSPSEETTTPPSMAERLVSTTPPPLHATHEAPSPASPRRPPLAPLGSRPRLNSHTSTGSEPMLARPNPLTAHRRAISASDASLLSALTNDSEHRPPIKLGQFDLPAMKISNLDVVDLPSSLQQPLLDDDEEDKDTGISFLALTPPSSPPMLDLLNDDSDQALEDEVERCLDRALRDLHHRHHHHPPSLVMNHTFDTEASTTERAEEPVDDLWSMERVVALWESAEKAMGLTLPLKDPIGDALGLAPLDALPAALLPRTGHETDPVQPGATKYARFLDKFHAAKDRPDVETGSGHGSLDRSRDGTFALPPRALSNPGGAPTQEWPNPLECIDSEHNEWSFVRVVLLSVVLPSLAVACVLFYGLGNPPTGVKSTDTAHQGASASWWILFLGIRQPLILLLARSTEVCVVRRLSRSSASIARVMGFHACDFLSQSLGWPCVLVLYGVFGFSFLYGGHPFANHWLYWQNLIELCNIQNPSGHVTSEWRYRNLLISAIVIGILVTAKRWCFHMCLVKRLHVNFAAQVMDALSERAGSDEEPSTDNSHPSPDRLPVLLRQPLQDRSMTVHDARLFRRAVGYLFLQSERCASSDSGAYLARCIGNAVAIDGSVQMLFDCVLWSVISVVALYVLGLETLALLLGAALALVWAATIVGLWVTGTIEGATMVLGRSFDIGDRIAIAPVNSWELEDSTLSCTVEMCNVLRTVLRSVTTGQVSTVTNASLARSRVVNLSHSIKARIQITLLFPALASSRRLQVFMDALSVFLRKRPQEWEGRAKLQRSLRGQEDDSEGLHYVLLLRHRQGWQHDDAILESKAEAASFCRLLQEKLRLSVITSRTKKKTGTSSRSTVSQDGPTSSAHSESKKSR